MRVNGNSGEQQLLGHAHSALADACIGRERFAEALEHIHAALDIRRAVGDRRGEGWLVEKSARVHRALGNHADAARAHDTAMQIARAEGDESLVNALISIKEVMTLAH